MKLIVFAILSLASLHLHASCNDQLIDNVRYSDQFTVPYILTSQNQSPQYVLILMPGGAGTLNPHINNEGKLQFDFAGNFLIRSRNRFCDSQFATASTNSTESPERMGALMNDLEGHASQMPKSVWWEPVGVPTPQWDWQKSLTVRSIASFIQHP